MIIDSFNGLSNAPRVFTACKLNLLHRIQEQTDYVCIVFLQKYYVMISMGADSDDKTRLIPYILRETG